MSGKQISKAGISQFNETSWKKVKDADKCRRYLFKEKKNFAIIIPDEYSSNHGYHQQCYRDFTAVQNVEIEETPASTFMYCGHLLNTLKLLLLVFLQKHAFSAMH